MIRAFRRARFAPLAAIVALLATMPITVSSLLHDESDDLLCHPAVVVHVADMHEVGGRPAEHSPDSQHCVLCHALQALRAISSAPRLAMAMDDARLVSAPVAAPASALFASSRPARAPPA